jgi:hypothetical protein
VLLRRTLTLAFVTVAVAACSIGEMTMETVTYQAQTRSSGAKKCEPPFAKPKLSELKECMNGAGHCVEKSKIPSTDGLEECDDEKVCVANEVIAAAGAKLKACTFKMTKEQPGVCIGLAIPEIVKFKDALKPEECKPDQRCVPCIDLRDGSDNPLCDDAIGVYEKPCTGGGGKGKAAESCCHMAGTCMVEEGLPPDQKENLNRDTCSDGKLCVPASQASGNPVKCEVLGADGVCIDYCFASMLKGAGKTFRAGCGPTEICMPCLLGKSQGMLGCD